ncbi:MAG TPA: CBS domain-containing protein [Acidimicrobiales bacterium]|nr:CBS domain-containing protein [Acidimicrobiales bacterium]
MSPRAAWRLESLGFGEVYDYVGSKMEWIGAGLPWEGSKTSQPKLADLATADVALCALDDTVGVVRAALGQDSVCLVVNEERIVLGLARAEALGPDDDRPVSEIMDEGPSTYRPHVPAAEMAERLNEHPQPHILVTTLDGRLVGVASAEDIARAAAQKDG